MASELEISCAASGLSTRVGERLAFYLLQLDEPGNEEEALRIITETVGQIPAEPPSSTRARAMGQLCQRMSWPPARFAGLAIRSMRAREEGRVDRALADAVAAQFRSVFPEGAFTQVDVLGYGDDPDVEPGESAIRAFVDRVGHPAETFEDDEEVIRAFEKSNSQAITRLHRDGQLPGIAWIQLIPDTPDRRARTLFCGASRACSSACGLTRRTRHRGSLLCGPG